MKKLGQLLMNLIMMSSGVIGAYIFFKMYGDIVNGDSIIMLSLIVIIELISLYFHIIIHELGHMVTGLISGYKFVSFRIANLTLVKADEGFKLRSYNIAGTAGQCLMSPPDYKDGNYPFVLYHMGGVLANLITSLIFTFIFLLFKPGIYFGFFCLATIVNGVAIALSNGIPFQNELVANDGYNVINLHKDKDALKAIWSSLKINELQIKGIPSSNIDPDWLELSDNADYTNPCVSSLLITKQQLAMEQQDFAKVKEYLDFIFSDKCKVHGIYEAMLKMDAMYIEIIEKGKDADKTIIADKKLKKTIKMLKTFPGIIRTEYALALLDGDNQKAMKYQKAFDKIASTYPYKNEIDSEKELMNLVKEKLSISDI